MKWAGPIYMLVVGLALVAFGLRVLRQRVAFLRRTCKTYGKLEGWSESTQLNSPRTRVYYYAEVVFTTPDGKSYRATSSTGTWPKPKKEPGSPVAVRFDPANPDDATIDTPFNLWSAPVAFLLLGGVCLFAFFHLLRAMN